MGATTSVRECEQDDCRKPAAWRISGMGPNCGDWSCCGWDELACDDHKAEALKAMPESWGLKASPLDGDRPLVSIITPTWQRHDLLIGCIEDVRAQTYPNVEHIVVSDGPDPTLRHTLWQAGHRPADLFNDGGPTRLQLTHLGRNWSTFLPNNFGIGPIVAGLLLARGEYVAVWCDDERAEPHHLTSMVDLLESSGADFAYPVVQFYRNGQSPDDGYQIGSDPPTHGQFTHYVARIEAFRKAMPMWGQHPVDWTLCEGWMANGATWAMLSDVTFSHRADH